MSTQIISVATKLKRIREAYVKQLPAQLETIRAAYDAFARKPAGGTELKEFHRRIHTLKGTSASFGLSGLSVLTASGEQLVKDAMEAETPPDKSWHQQMQKCLNRMEQEVKHGDLSQTADFRAVELVAATEGSGGREQKVIYLCEDDSYQRLTLATQIECFGFQVISFGELEQLRKAVRNSAPDAIVMDIIFPDQPMGGAEMMEKLLLDSDTPIPTIFISSQNELPYRLSAVRAGSSAYFVKPLNVTELCSTLSALTSADTPVPYRIMIVDDDQHLSELYATILQEAGMITITVNDPLQAMTPLVEFMPDLILTDMYMPGCNGMELAKAIRQIGAAFSIPIVYLSSETDIDKQFHAIRMGGDEFLTKPISPEHLISAVAVRAERMKIIRSFMVRDSMTGLFNHTSSKEQLDLAIAQARRNGNEVCFAMIDVDKFKQINDSYGHPTGDQVLITLANFLRQRLRKSDVVGRYGGEEFSVMLQDCDIDTAVSLLNQLRESFSAIRFPTGQDYFSLTFSAGVAPLSRYNDALSLCKAADEALYAAKSKGRNMVVAAGDAG